MWQNILVFAILALAGGIVLWRAIGKISGRPSAGGCCGGCSGCGTGGKPGSKPAPLAPLPGSGCGCGHRGAA